MRADLDQALSRLQAGEVIGIPTETVYGLAADARNEKAVHTVFRLKHRPAHHPLIVHLASAAQITDWACAIPDCAWQLAQTFWPGPLTLVLQSRQDVLGSLTGGQTTIALRVPKHPLALSLLQRFGSGLAAPSANRFGQLSPTSALHVRRAFGTELALILDGGPCAVGLESTIVGLDTGQARLLRPGGIALQDIEAVLQSKIDAPGPPSTTRVPGQLASHYSPQTPLYLGALPALLENVQTQSQRGKKVALFHYTALTWDWPLGNGGKHVQLSDDPLCFARALYSVLWDHDDGQFDALFFQTPPETLPWQAVCDRLRKAAQKWVSG